MMSKVDSQLSI